MDRAAALRLPVIYQSPETAEEGGFAAYGPRLLQIFREITARQLVQLSRGTKPVDLPVEQPTKFELVIDLKTAKALGLTVPKSLLRAVPIKRSNNVACLLRCTSLFVARSVGSLPCKPTSPESGVKLTGRDNWTTAFTQLGRRAPLPRTNFGRYDLVVGGKG